MLRKEVVDHLFSDEVLIHLAGEDGDLGYEVPDMNINSGFRCVHKNMSTRGASPGSMHQLGLAVDLAYRGIGEPTSAQLEVLRDLLLHLGCGFTKVYRSHVHGDWRGTG